jgi:acyl carrier protein
MTTTSHAKEIRDFVVTNFLFGEADSLKDDTSFMNSGVLDSTGLLELVHFLESTFQIKVEAEELVPANLNSVSLAAAFVTRKLTERGDHKA